MAMELHKEIETVYKSLLSLHPPLKSSLLGSAKLYLKSLHSSTASLASYIEALNNYSTSISKQNDQLRQDFHSVHERLQSVHQKQLKLLKAFYIDYILPVENGVEKELGGVKQHHRQYVQTHQKLSKKKMKKLDKKVVTEFYRNSLKNVVGLERGLFEGVLEKQGIFIGDDDHEDGDDDDCGTIVDEEEDTCGNGCGQRDCCLDNKTQTFGKERGDNSSPPGQPFFHKEGVGVRNGSDENDDDDDEPAIDYSDDDEDHHDLNNNNQYKYYHTEIVAVRGSTQSLREETKENKPKMFQKLVKRMSMTLRNRPSGNNNVVEKDNGFKWSGGAVVNSSSTSTDSLNVRRMQNKYNTTNYYPAFGGGHINNNNSNASRPRGRWDDLWEKYK